MSSSDEIQVVVPSTRSKARQTKDGGTTPGGKLKRTLASMLITANKEEVANRKQVLKGKDLFRDYENYLKCTKCNDNFAKVIKNGGDLLLHPILKVLFCQKCTKFYGDGEFSLDEDEEDKYCRWCGEGGKLFLCSKCICGFCPKCIKKHLGPKSLKDVENDDHWECLICQPTPLWYLRHVTHLALKVAKENQKAKKDKQNEALAKMLAKKKEISDKPPPKRRVLGRSSKKKNDASSNDNDNSESEEENKTRPTRGRQAKPSKNGENTRIGKEKAASDESESDNSKKKRIRKNPLNVSKKAEVKKRSKQDMSPSDSEKEKKKSKRSKSVESDDDKETSKKAQKRKSRRDSSESGSKSRKKSRYDSSADESSQRIEKRKSRNYSSDSGSKHRRRSRNDSSDDQRRKKKNRSRKTSYDSSDDDVSSRNRKRKSRNHSSDSDSRSRRRSRHYSSEDDRRNRREKRKSRRDSSSDSGNERSQRKIDRRRNQRSPGKEMKETKLLGSPRSHLPPELRKGLRYTDRALTSLQDMLKVCLTTTHNLLQKSANVKDEAAFTKVQTKMNKLVVAFHSLGAHVLTQHENSKKDSDSIELKPVTDVSFVEEFVNLTVDSEVSLVHEVINADCDVIVDIDGVPTASSSKPSAEDSTSKAISLTSESGNMDEDQTKDIKEDVNKEKKSEENDENASERGDVSNGKRSGYDAAEDDDEGGKVSKDGDEKETSSKDGAGNENPSLNNSQDGEENKTTSRDDVEESGTASQDGEENENASRDGGKKENVPNKGGEDGSVSQEGEESESASQEGGDKDNVLNKDGEDGSASQDGEESRSASRDGGEKENVPNNEDEDGNTSQGGEENNEDGNASQDVNENDSSSRNGGEHENNSQNDNTNGNDSLGENDGNDFQGEDENASQDDNDSQGVNENENGLQDSQQNGNDSAGSRGKNENGKDSPTLEKPESFQNGGTEAAASDEEPHNNTETASLGGNDSSPETAVDVDKQRVLGSTSEESEEDVADNYSSDSSYGRKKVKKSIRQRTEERKSRIKKEKGESKKQSDEVESLVNLKSLAKSRRDRSDTNKIGSHDDSDDDKMAEQDLQKRDKKTEDDGDNKLKLTDMTGVVSSGSADEETDEDDKKGDFFKSFEKNEKNLLKDLVLDSSSSGDELSNNENDDTELNKKKAKQNDDKISSKNNDSNDDSDSKKSKNKKRSSEDGNSETSDDGKGKKKPKQRMMTLGLESSSDDDVITKKIANGLVSDSASEMDEKNKLALSGSDEDIIPAKKIGKILSDSDSEFSLQLDEDLTSDSEAEDVKKVKDSDEDKKKKKRKRIRGGKSGSSSSESDLAVLSQKSPGKGGRKNIKSLMKKDSLEMETKQAVKAEEERRARLAKRRKEFKQLFPDEKDRIILDFNEKGEVLVEVAPRLVKKLKPHQKAGVSFMWDNCFESLKAMETSNGGGCILAHCMGLGKTLQVITLLHTVLTGDMGVSTALVICPLNTVANWVHEFEMWLSVARCNTIDIYDLNQFKNLPERRYQLKQWQKEGGVMIISYNMFRGITTKKKNSAVLEALVKPGPDIVICDEGHLLKNEASGLSISTSKIQTARRVVLTGTPLQNNLKEYHCMVQFIKPNILGNKMEFANRFVNPIENGQFEDSTPRDVEIMKRRSHVLHTMLSGCIQRQDYTVLTPFLPPKQEFVLSIFLSEPLADLYRHYIETQSRGRAQGSRASASLFSDYQSLQRIWTHPMTMMAQFHKDNEREEKKKENLDEYESDFINDESASGSGSDSSVICDDSKPKKKGTRANPRKSPTPPPPTPPPPAKPWWEGLIAENLLEDERVSNKLMVFWSIAEESAKKGDKLLVFSQSLYTLDLIEHFLNVRNSTGAGEWEIGVNYFRLDGSTSSEKRAAFCKKFNREDNHQAKLFLISTKAGGLGINLVGANRVLLFDACWNPSHDLQSIFRIYRFGQKKPCYIYRLLAEATMEEKIYERQVNKLSLAHRVVDEHQIERHYTMGNLQELYRFEPTPRDQWKTPIVPKDDLLAKILKEHEDVIVSYHEHDSLLENKHEEELTEEERKRAWEEYEISRNPPPPPPPSAAFQSMANMAAAYNASQTLSYLMGGNNKSNIAMPSSTQQAAMASLLSGGGSHSVYYRNILQNMAASGKMPTNYSEIISNMAAGKPPSAINYGPASSKLPGNYSELLSQMTGGKPGPYKPQSLNNPYMALVNGNKSASKPPVANTTKPVPKFYPVKPMTEKPGEKSTSLNKRLLNREGPARLQALKQLDKLDPSKRNQVEDDDLEILEIDPLEVVEVPQPKRTIRANPFAVEKKTASGKSGENSEIQKMLERLGPSELLTMGQTYSMMPAEGENIAAYRTRLAAAVIQADTGK